jgi:hypothetical protein
MQMWPCHAHIAPPLLSGGGVRRPGAGRLAERAGISLWITGRVSCGNRTHNPPPAWDNSASDGDKRARNPKRPERRVHNSAIRVDNRSRFSTGYAPGAGPIQARTGGLSTNPHRLLRTRRNHPYINNIDMNKDGSDSLSTADWAKAAQPNPSPALLSCSRSPLARRETTGPGYLYPPTGICYNGEAISGMGRT